MEGQRRSTVTHSTSEVMDATSSGSDVSYLCRMAASARSQITNSLPSSAMRSRLLRITRSFTGRWCGIISEPVVAARVPVPVLAVGLEPLAEATSTGTRPVIAVIDAVTLVSGELLLPPAAAPVATPAAGPVAAAAAAADAAVALAGAWRADAEAERVPAGFWLCGSSCWCCASEAAAKALLGWACACACEVVCACGTGPAWCEEEADAGADPCDDDDVDVDEDVAPAAEAVTDAAIGLASDSAEACCRGCAPARA